MNASLFWGLLIAATLALSSAPRQPQHAAEDPCAMARRIAQSPACLAGSSCRALDLWRETFAVPRALPAGPGAEPRRLPTFKCTAR